MLKNTKTMVSDRHIFESETDVIYSETSVRRYRLVDVNQKQYVMLTVMIP